MRSILIALLVFTFAGPAVAEDERVATIGEIRLLHAWARAAEAGASTLVFVEIDNDGPADRLVAVASDVAAGARVVGMTMTNGEAAVREIGVLDIGPGETELDPGGLAIELTGLSQALVEGGEAELEVTFERAGTVHLHAEVLAADADEHPHAGHAH